MATKPLDHPQRRPAGIVAGELVMARCRLRVSRNVGNKGCMEFIQNAQAGLLFQRFQRCDGIITPALPDKNPGLKQRLDEAVEATIGQSLQSGFSTDEIAFFDRLDDDHEPGNRRAFFRGRDTSRHVGRGCDIAICKLGQERPPQKLHVRRAFPKRLFEQARRVGKIPLFLCVTPGKVITRAGLADVHLARLRRVGGIQHRRIALRRTGA